MALGSADKLELIKEFGDNQKDTGSVPVQVAIFTTRIKELTQHLKEFKKDHSSRVGLLKLVGQRKRLLRYFKRKNYSEYMKLIGKLGLKDKL
jgi:small subunit ribosomal protein S15